MNADTTFAVVDLETTGTSVKDGDRMIQFGCALVRHGKIIQTISQMINPDRSVPQTIQRLTGISRGQDYRADRGAVPALCCTPG